MRHACGRQDFLCAEAEQVPVSPYSLTPRTIEGGGIAGVGAVNGGRAWRAGEREAGALAW